jgi:hypothetical protein
VHYNYAQARYQGGQVGVQTSTTVAQNGAWTTFAIYLLAIHLAAVARRAGSSGAGAVELNVTPTLSLGYGDATRGW